MIQEKHEESKTAELFAKKNIVFEAQKNNQNGEKMIEEVPLRIKNRRYAKLKQMRQEGFFEEQDIMLRYPTLYYQYVGKYKKNMKLSSGSNFSSMSNFLQSQIINSEYRRLIEQEQQIEQLNKQMKNLKPNKKQFLQKIQEDQSYGEPKYKEMLSEETPRMQSSQMVDEGQQGIEDEFSFGKMKQFKEISEQDLQLQEQALLDALQLEFLNGKLAGINYELIDENEELDDVGLMNQDLEDKYFEEISPEGNSDPENNTGIQDF